VSSFYPGWPPARAIDGDINTSWFTAIGDAANLGTTPFFEILLPEDATVTELRMFGNRESADGFDFFAGIFQLFDAPGTVLYDSGEVVLPAPDRDVTLAIPHISGIRKVRFTATADESDEPGFAELEVIGEFVNPVPQVEVRNAAEIPGSRYSGTGSDPQEIIVGIPDAGAYHLDVSGTGEGPFTVTVNTLDAVGNIISQQTFTGMASTGSMTSFDLTLSSEGVIRKQFRIIIELLPNGDVRVTWDASSGAVLVEADDPAGPYNDVQPSPVNTGSYTVTPAGAGQKFYGLRPGQ
jgi:hypothetical protein